MIARGDLAVECGYERLAEDADKQFPAADAQRPQQTEQGAALHHRK